MQDSLEIQEHVEKICSRGCDFVRQVMADLQSGREREDVACLSGEQRRVLLRELSVIMAVYEAE